VPYRIKSSKQKGKVKIEVDAAKALFDSLKKKRYFAYTVKGDGGKGRVIHEFDPDAEKIIMALPMRGG
jgi:hypothetical protein